MLRNTAQKLIVVAFGADGPVTGEAANITCDHWLDGVAQGALADTNPTEIGDGFYAFDVSAAESNGDALHYLPACSTSGVGVAIWPGHYPAPVTTAADATGSVTGGVTNNTTVTVYQDDDVDGDFSLVFSITDASIDFSGVTAVLFAAGSAAGTPLIEQSTATITAQAAGSMTVKITLAPADLQLAAAGYPYTLKGVWGTKRRTIHAGTLDLNPTYQTFR